MCPRFAQDQATWDVPVGRGHRGRFLGRRKVPDDEAAKITHENAGAID
jgi:hypothetical protein